jgi:hypothetical protein
MQRLCRCTSRAVCSGYPASPLSMTNARMACCAGQRPDAAELVAVSAMPGTAGVICMADGQGHRARTLCRSRSRGRKKPNH